MLFRAALSTPHFDFEVYAHSADDAAGALIDALNTHGRQYRLPKSWYFDLLQDAEVSAIEMQVPYRDGITMEGDRSHAGGRILRSGRVVWEGGAS
jgi:hypothetical protein